MVYMFKYDSTHGKYKERRSDNLLILIFHFTKFNKIHVV